MSTDSTALTIATVALVPSLFGAMLPPLSEVRATEHDPAQRASVRTAGLVAATVVVAVGISSGSRQAAVVGGAAVVVFSILYTQAVGASWLS